MGIRNLILLLIIMAAFMAACKPDLLITPEQPVPQGEQLGGYTDLEEALVKLGATVAPAGEVNQPFFSVPGRIIRVNGSDVQTFEYPSEIAREAESSQITTQGSFATTVVSWVDQPNFWTQGRMIVLYVGQKPEIKALLTQVMDTPILEGEVPAVVLPPVDWFSAADLQTIIFQQAYEPTFSRPENSYPYGRLSPFTLYADGTLIYGNEGELSAAQQIMQVKLSPQETQELMASFLEIGIAGLESYTDECKDMGSGNSVCVADAAYTILRMMLPTGGLHEVKIFADFANDPAAFENILSLVRSYSHPEARPFSPEGATLFLRPIDQAEGVEVVPWPLESSLLKGLVFGDLELAAMSLRGEALAGFLASIPGNIGDYFFEQDGQEYAVYFVPWLPGEDFSAQIEKDFPSAPASNPSYPSQFTLPGDRESTGRPTLISLATPTPTQEPLQASPSPPSIAETPPKLASARDALVTFFAAISSGDYPTASSLYGYGVNETQELAQIVLDWRDGDPAWKADPTDFAAVLEKVCTSGFLCLPLRSIVSETPISPAETEFIVELSGPEGELFVLGPCCGATETEMPSRSQFAYIVARDEIGCYKVKWTPILEP